MDNRELNLIYGRHAIEEFFKKHPKMMKKIWVKDRALLKGFTNINDYNIQTIFSDEETISKMFKEPVNHQGMVCEVKEYNYVPFSEAINKNKDKESVLTLILDQIHDPYNFGAIIRSASLLGVDHIVILDRKQAQVNSTVVKTSAGTVYDLMISKVANLNNAIRDLKENGFWIYASNLNSESVDIRKVDFANKTVLIVGNEQKGVSDLITKNSDLNVHIPSNKNIDSFNVSVASALMLYEIANKISKI